MEIKQLSNRFAIYLTIGRMISMVAAFIMPLVLVRCMSQHDYGIFSQFFTLYGAIYVILALGVHTNIFYFCPSASKNDSDKYVSNTLSLLIFFGIIGAAIMFIPAVQNVIFGDSELGRYAAFIILSMTSATPMNMVSPLNTTRKDKWGAMLFPGFVAFSRIVVVFLVVRLFNNLDTLFWWIFIYQIFIGLLVIIYVKAKIHFSLDLKFMKQQLTYSIPFGLAIALQLFSNYFDKFVCIKFIDPSDYAVYSVAFLSIPGINQIYDSLCQVNIVNMSNSYRSGQIENILPQYSNFVVKTFSFSTPIILAVSLYSEEIIQFLYTEKYSSSAFFFRIYSLSFLTAMLGAGTILRSMGKTNYSFISFLLTCIVGLPATYFLVKSYGTSGAIVGAMINIILPRIVQMIFEVKSLNTTICKFLPWKSIGILFFTALLVLIPFCIIKVLFHPNIYICIIESAIYVLVLYALYIYRDMFILEKPFVIKQIKKITRSYE